MAVCRAEQPRRCTVIAASPARPARHLEDVGNTAGAPRFQRHASARRGHHSRPALAHPARSPREHAPSAPTTNTSPSLPTPRRRPSRGRRPDPRLPARPRHSSSAHDAASAPVMPLMCSQAASRASSADAPSPAARAAKANTGSPSPRKTRQAPRRPDSRLGSRSGRGRLTLVCEYRAQTPEAAHPPDLIVSRLALGRHLADLCDSSGEIATLRLRQPRARSGTHASWTHRRSHRRGRVLLRRPRAPRADHPRCRALRL